MHAPRLQRQHHCEVCAHGAMPRSSAAWGKSRPTERDAPRRPLVLGQRVSEARIEYCIASEDCAFGPIGFQRVRDIAPGEMLVQSTLCPGKEAMQLTEQPKHGCIETQQRGAHELLLLRRQATHNRRQPDMHVMRGLFMQAGWVPSATAIGESTHA